MTVTYKAAGRAKRYTLHPEGEVELPSGACVCDLKAALFAPHDVPLKAICDGDVLPDSSPLTEGCHVEFVILVTAG